MENPNKNLEENLLFTPDGKAYEVTVEGSLGLLALGYAGLMLWRKKRIEVARSQQHISEIPKTDENE